MADTRFIICAAGEQSRWKDYRGMPKHLAPIRGEPVIHRTLRLLRELGAVDIVLVAKNPAYQAHGVSISRSVQESILPHTGIGASFEMWDQRKRNTIMFGDVWFSDDAMQKVVSHDLPGIWWFGRSGKGKLEHPYRELFAVTFTRDSRRLFLKHIDNVRKLREKFNHPTAGGWFIYNSLHRITMNECDNVPMEHFIEIDDETTDFDTPEHYEAWISRFEKPA